MTEVQMIEATADVGDAVKSMRASGLLSVATVHKGKTYLVGFADLIQGAIANPTATLGQVASDSPAIHPVAISPPSVVVSGQALEIPDHLLAGVNFVLAGYKYCKGKPAHIYPADSNLKICDIDDEPIVSGP